MLWEPEKGVSIVAWGPGTCLFCRWDGLSSLEPRGQFLHLFIWHNNICKIFYCPQSVRATIHVGQKGEKHQSNTGAIFLKFAQSYRKGPRKIPIALWQRMQIAAFWTDKGFVQMGTASLNLLVLRKPLLSSFLSSLSTLPLPFKHSQALSTPIRGLLSAASVPPFNNRVSITREAISRETTLIFYTCMLLWLFYFIISHCSSLIAPNLYIKY